MHWFNDAYAGRRRRIGAHRRCSRDLAGLPPAMVVTASLDPLRDQGRAYAAALIAAGVPVVYREAAGNIHGFLNLRAAIPSSRRRRRGLLAALKDGDRRSRGRTRDGAGAAE